MYSRLAYHEGKSLTRQILLYTGGSIALIIAFILVILPGYIKFLAYRNFSSKLTFSNDTVLPSRPRLAAAVDATSSATISLAGEAQTGQKIVLLHNGAPAETSTASEGGSFLFQSVSLELGQNTFTTVAQDDRGNRSNPSNTVIVAYVKDAPKIEISTPVADSVISQHKLNPITVSGKTEAGNRVFLNDRLLFVTSDGSFTGQIQLQEGDNTLIVRALNAANVETLKEIPVRFSP